MFSLILPILILLAPQKDLHHYTLNGNAQGTTYSISWYAPDSLISRNSIDSILLLVDQSMSLYKPNSLINRFNASDTGIIMDDHLQNVVEKSILIFNNSSGIFDMTVYPLVNAWGFGTKGRSVNPDSSDITKALQCVGTEKLFIKNQFLYKEFPCIKIDLNGIAQGYTVDLIADFMEANSISSYLVELGGEIRICGKKPSGEKMRIGIEAPGPDDGDDNIIQKIISPVQGAVTSSGNYRNFYELNGKTISHIIDPRTGYPAENELITVTVYAPDAMTADAYDNVLMVMGLKKGLEFVESHPEIAAHFIYRDADNSIKDSSSTRFKTLFAE